MVKDGRRARDQGASREREGEGELQALACIPRRIKLHFSIMLKTRLFRAEIGGGSYSLIMAMLQVPGKTRKRPQQQARGRGEF